MDVFSTDGDFYSQLTSTPTKSSCVLDDWNTGEVTCPVWLEDWGSYLPCLVGRLGKLPALFGWKIAIQNQNLGTLYC